MKNPPRWAAGLLRRLLNDRERDMILGDLLEEFQDRGGQANRWYLRQVLSFLTPARLTRLIPHRVAFALAAGLAEYLLIWVLPARAGVWPEWEAVWIVGALLLSIGSIVAMARESEAAASARLVGTISLFWFFLFAGVTAWIFHRPVFSPVPTVATFLVCVLGASLQASLLRGRAALGVSAAAATGLLAASLAGVTLTVSGVPHPPLQTLPLLPGAAALLRAVGGLLGSRFGRSQTQVLNYGLRI